MKISKDERQLQRLEHLTLLWYGIRTLLLSPLLLLLLVGVMVLIVAEAVFGRPFQIERGD